MSALYRHHTPRSDLPTRGGQAGIIAKSKGRPFLPWQQLAADVSLEYYPSTGLYRYGIVIVTVQRQAGKTTYVGVLADHRCVSQPNARVWFTMDTGKKADSWMREEHLPSLKVFGDPKKSTRYSASLRAGELGPKWANGSSFLTFPPTRDGLHSKQSDLAILSEAWSLSLEQGTDLRQAINPTMSTRFQPGMHGAQLVIDSTLGDDSSVFLDAYIDQGIASLDQPDTNVCIIDYGIPDDADPTNLDVIREWHPAYGYTFTERALQLAVTEFENDPSGFARAYGNRASRSRTAAIDPNVWQKAQRPRPARPDRAGLALDATPSGDRYALAAAWRGSDGHAYLELLANGPATRQTPALIAAVLRARRVPLVVDRAAIGAVELVDAIAREYPSATVDYVGMHEYGSACAVVKRELYAGTCHHFGQDAMTTSVQVVTQRDLGDGAFGWGRKKSTGSICEFVAPTLALRAFDTLPAARSKPRILTSVSHR